MDCKRGRDKDFRLARLVNMSGSSEVGVEEQESAVQEPEEHEGRVSEDGEGTPGGASPRPSPRSARGRMIEAAPPTYEEALSLFVRDGGAKGASGGMRALEGPKGPSGAGALRAIEGPPSRRPSASDDYELAERLQQEEIERASLSSASSAGDFRLLHRNPIYGQRLQQPVRGRLRTIPENEEIMFDPSPLHSNSDSYSRACCYYSCFGFALFTNRLSPVLRDAWKRGMKHAINTSLPAFSTQSRYILFCIQALISIVCIILSFASTSFQDENLVRSVSLSACLVVNLLERMVSWCRCCRSRKETYNTYSDITRNLLTDIFLYPAVIASIMNTLNSQSYNVVLSLFDSSVYANSSNANDARKDDAINFSMNALVLLLFVVMVHFLRFWQLGCIVKSLVVAFKNDISEARSSARVFIVVLFLHVLIQSVVQILYIFLIGYRIHAERIDPSQPQILGISVYLFIMMVCGELVPLMGIFMYFITAQKWAEEFPIAFLLDRTPSPHSLSATTPHQVEYQFRSLHAFNMKCSGCLFGLIHPLVSPLQILVSITFFSLWILFVFTYPVSAMDSSSLDLFLSNSSHGLVGTIGVAIAYGFLVLLSFFGNLLPIVYGFLGLVMLPFWGIFYAIVGFSSLCHTKS